MKTKTMLAAVGAITAFAASISLATSAYAGTETFDLTGSVTGFTYATDSNGDAQGSIGLSGLSPTVVSPGDTLSISAVLDGPLVVPPGTDFSYVEVVFLGSGFDGTPVSVSDDFNFSAAGLSTGAYAGSTGTSNALITEAVFFSQPLTFDSLTDTSAVLDLAGPVTLTSAYLDVGAINNAPVVSAAPEPSTWALMLLGLGGVGMTLRRAKKATGFRSTGALAA